MLCSSYLLHEIEYYDTGFCRTDTVSTKFCENRSAGSKVEMGDSRPHTDRLAISDIFFAVEMQEVIVCTCGLDVIFT
jgi:hypothetical protein